jgi:hypothetical protein
MEKVKCQRCRDTGLISDDGVFTYLCRECSDNSELEVPSPTPVEKMHALLDKAKEIVGGARHEQYGNPMDNHTCCGELWSSYLRRRGLLKTDAFINASDVCWMMILLKASREAHWSQTDNALDCVGYAANAEACRVT